MWIKELEKMDDYIKTKSWWLALGKKQNPNQVTNNPFLTTNNVRGLYQKREFEQRSQGIKNGKAATS